MLHTYRVWTWIHRRRGIALALVAAVAVHALLFWWLADRIQGRAQVERPIAEDAAPPAAPEFSSVALLADLPLVELPAGEVPDVVPGSHSRSSESTANPHPRADRELPGKRRASRGGGATGGPDDFTGRRDRETYRTQSWNDPDDTRLPRHEQGRRRSATVRSPESLTRQRERGFAERTERRRRAQQGAEQAAQGGVDSSQPGGGGLPADRRDWRSADPMFSGPAGRADSKRVAGRTSARGRALTEVGAPATEADTRGQLRDRENVGAASSELDPAPIEMTQASAGGRAEGVRGQRPGPGISARGQGRTGTAASSARTGDADAMPSVQARRRNPYFRRMYRRMDELIEYPKDLALALRQGEVVIRFKLSAGGQMSDLMLTKSSGYPAFDKQVLRAVRKAAPFGRVPTAVLDGRSAIRVSVPYKFKNPLIR